MPSVRVVHGKVDLFRSLLEPRQHLLELGVYDRVVACWGVLAEVRKEERVFADALDRLWERMSEYSNTSVDIVLTLMPRSDSVMPFLTHTSF